MIYPTAMTHCAACGVRVKRTRLIGLYRVRPSAALAYLLCKQCGAYTRNGGLPDHLLAKVEASLEPEVKAYGFKPGHCGGRYE